MINKFFFFRLKREKKTAMAVGSLIQINYRYAGAGNSSYQINLKHS